MRPKTRRWFWATIALGAVFAVSAGVLVWHSGRLPRRFAVVDPGRLYRSGLVTPAQLERLHRAYGIRRVICLLDPAAPETQAERAAVERLGIEWHNVPLRGDGSSTPADRRQLRDLLTDPTTGPTLVHCAAGVNRTGLAIGIYRLHRQGWSLAEVLEEMRAFDFQDLPRHENLRQALFEEAALSSVSGAEQPLP